MLSSQDLGWLVEMRHHLHRHPELSCAEEQTAAFVAKRLTDMGLPVVTGIGGDGLVATIGKDGPAVGLRADMDALAITELTGLPYAGVANVIFAGADVPPDAVKAIGEAFKTKMSDPAQLAAVAKGRFGEFKPTIFGPEDAQRIYDASLATFLANQEVYKAMQAKYYDKYWK